MITKHINWRYIQDIRNGDWRLMKGDFGEYIVMEALASAGYRTERLGRRAEGLPDFKISGLPVMVEVKSHKKKTGSLRAPYIWQKKRFISLRLLGWRIYVASPRIEIDNDNENVICSGIEWYSFSSAGKLEKLEDCPFSKTIK